LPTATSVAGSRRRMDIAMLSEMYQPAHRKFEVATPGSLLTELCASVPATLVTHGDGFRASILPMLFDPEDGPHGTLRGHLARGNPHWRELVSDLAALCTLGQP